MEISNGGENGTLSKTDFFISCEIRASNKSDLFICGETEVVKLGH